MEKNHVTVFDFTTRTFTSIPQSELAQGMAKAKFVGHEGSVWIDPNQAVHLAKSSPYRHPPFAGERQNAVLSLVDAFPDVKDHTYEFWEDGFRKDVHPDREIAIWLHMASVYRRFAVGRSLPYRQELFRLVVTCGCNADPKRISSVFKRNLISKADFLKITATFYK